MKLFSYLSSAVSTLAGLSSQIIDGLNKENIRQLKKYVKEGKCAEGNLIEVMCCEGGCINGNATINDTKISKKLLKELSDKSKDIERKD